MASFQIFLRERGQDLGKVDYISKISPTLRTSYYILSRGNNLKKCLLKNSSIKGIPRNFSKNSSSMCQEFLEWLPIAFYLLTIRCLRRHITVFPRVRLVSFDWCWVFSLCPTFFRFQSENHSNRTLYLYTKSMHCIGLQWSMLSYPLL